MLYYTAGINGGANLFAYCLNNPVMYTDPEGYFIVAFLVSLGLSVGAAWAVTGVVVAVGLLLLEMQTHTISDTLEWLWDTAVGVFDWILYDIWEPGTWPGDDPIVSPGDGFVWRPGKSNGGDWFNPLTGDQLHPELNHPLPKGPHWNWRNKLKDWLRKKGFDIWPPGGGPPTPA